VNRALTSDTLLIDTIPRRRTLKDEAVDRIRGAIIRRELNPGERITELGLARRLGVGQPTIREALIELEHQGFVERSSPRMTRVTSLTQRDVDEIYMVRVRLEVLALELVLAQPGVSLDNIEFQCRKMMQMAKMTRIAEFLQADLDFHAALWLAAGNRALREILERLVPKLFALGMIRHSKATRSTMRRIAAEHALLLEAIREHKIKKAMDLLSRSLAQGQADDMELTRES
jgi:DNA-binding GntR family transcriptional regulator